MNTNGRSVMYSWVNMNSVANLLQQPDFNAWLIREVANNGECRNAEIKYL